MSVHISVKLVAVVVLGVAGSTFMFAQQPTQRAPQDQAQQGQGQGQARGGAREKAAGKRPARRKPKGNAPVGLIVPYPFPPALIIRQTPEAHDEVRAFLNMLRYR